jgi:predicted acylesterase/phospholipase RssA
MSATVTAIRCSVFSTRRENSGADGFSCSQRSDGTLEQTRIKQPWPKDRLFRILSLDGGGIRSLFGAAYLAEIERKYPGGQSIAKHFDIVADTSTGGIIALGLATGKPAAEISKIYTEKAGIP